MSEQEEYVSAKGERAAIGGYKPQYDEFARLVYDSMRNRTLVGIAVADPEACKLDDIFFETKTEIHAYQMKWTINDGIFVTYKYFRDIFKDIFASWVAIKNRFPNKTVVAHFTTNKQPSKADKITGADGTMIGTFHDFIVSLYSEKAEGDNMDKWDILIDELKGLTGNDPLFDVFWTSFSIETSIEVEAFRVSDSDFSTRTQDVLKLRDRIFEMAGSRTREVYRSFDELVNDMGWGQRFKTTFNHMLHVPDNTYEPICETLKALDEKVKELSSGYIFLEGTPGSGKSTLLSRWSETLQNKVVSYYAFDFTAPSSLSNNPERGEAENMLFDIVLQLAEQGFRGKNNSLIKRDITELVSRFKEQMSLMTNYYHQTGLPCVLIIDGLDHITREYHPDKNLLAYLPVELPDGLIVILGSQYYRLLKGLPTELKKAYNKRETVVRMAGLSKESFANFVGNSLSILSESDLETLYAKTQGHPLHVHYSIEQLKTSENVHEAILGLPQYDDDITNYYDRLLNPVLKDVKLMNMLGLMSRIEGAVKWAFVKEWGFDEQTLQQFVEKVRPLMNCDDKMGIYSFFHNSFRQYLLEETSKDIMTNCQDDGINRSFLSQLADLFLKSKVETTWKANKYLYLSGRYEEFLDVTQPEVLERQMLNFRPIKEILSDAKNGMMVAYEIRNIYLAVRYHLMLAELELIDFQDTSVLYLSKELLCLGMGDIVKEHIYENKTLLCSPMYALKQAVEFYRTGDIEEAKYIFELSYPTFLYFHHDDNHREWRNEFSELKSWSSVASLFLKESQLCEKIEEFVSYLIINKPEYSNWDAENISNSIWNEVIKMQIDLGNADYAQELRYHINVESDYGYNCLIKRTVSLVDYYLRNDNTNMARKMYIAMERSLADTDNPILYLLLTKYSWILYGDKFKSESYLKKVDPNKLIGWKTLKTESRYKVFSPIRDYIYFMTLFGYEVKLDNLFPYPKSGTDEEYLIEFARAVGVVAIQKAQCVKTERLPQGFDFTIHSLLTFYDRNKEKYNHHNRYYFELNNFRIDFFKDVIDMATVGGKDGLQHVAQQIFRLIEENKWGGHLQREVLMYLYDKGSNSGEITKAVKSLENVMLDQEDVSGRTMQCHEQAKAWLKLGNKDTCLYWLRKYIKESFGINYSKDSQPSEFVNWVRNINRFLPDNALERLIWICKRIRYIKNTTDNSSHRDTVDELMETAFDINLTSGVKMCLWTLEADLSWFTNVFSIILVHLFKEVSTKEEYESVLDIYCRIFLFFDLSETGHPNLLLQAYNKGVLLYDGHLPAELNSFIESSIKTQCCENASNNLLKKIKNPFEKKVNENRKNLYHCETWDEACEAFKESKPTGWVRYWDGGSRLESLGEMMKFDADKTREVAFESYANDIAKHGVALNSLLYLHEILPLISANIDRKRVFDEEFDYMNRILRGDAVCESDCPDLIPEDKEVDEVVVDILLFLSSSPIKLLHERAAYVLALLVNRGNHYAIDCLCKPKNGDLLLEVGMFMAALDSNNLNIIGSAVSPYAISTHYKKRHYAKQILSKIGLPLPEPEYRELPAVYELYFDSRRKVIGVNNTWSSDDVPPINWGDPMEVTSCYRHLREFLYRLTGYDEYNIAYRAVQLAQKYGSLEDWTVDNEKKLRTHLENIGMMFSFPRPRSLAVENGIMEVTTELLDSHKIEENQIENIFESYDHYIMTWPEKERPDFIHCVHEEDHIGVKKDWLERVSQHIRFGKPLCEFNGMSVIGESTYITNQEGERPTENYYQAVSPSELLLDSADIFGLMTRQMSSNYYSCANNKSDVIILREHYFVQFDKKTTFIALNPAIAYSLGWKPSQQGLFAWQDGDGNKMVESIYWRQGNTDGWDYSRQETSEGWIVIASREAYGLIQDLVGILYQHKCVNRTFLGKKFPPPTNEACVVEDLLGNAVNSTR